MQCYGSSTYRGKGRSLSHAITFTIYVTAVKSLMHSLSNIQQVTLRTVSVGACQTLGEESLQDSPHAIGRHNLHSIERHDVVVSDLKPNHRPPI